MREELEENIPLATGYDNRGYLLTRSRGRLLWGRGGRNSRRRGRVVVSNGRKGVRQPSLVVIERIGRTRRGDTRIDR